ncbi:MAG TPA: amidase [Pseudomonadales bacterium]
MTDLHYRSLASVCARIKSGELQSAAVVGSLLERIATLDPTLHAYAQVLGASALERAAALDRARADGERLGALHGVPIALKDIINVRGLPTASGTRVMADFIATETATVVERLEAAGAVIIGKTQLTEGAYGVHHPDIEAPRNPWSAERWTGVSSSGSGVAVAAGLCFGALGSDTGGSIRFPSASCATVGLKPTYGRVSRHGVFPLAESLDHIGPMTRTVADAARLLQVMAGPDPRDPTALVLPVPNWAAELGAPVQGLSVGVDWRYVRAGVEPIVADGVEQVARALAGLGLTIREVSMPDGYRELVDHWGVTCSVECARAHRAYYPSRASEYGPVLAELIEFGLNQPAAAYERLESARADFRSDLDRLLAEVDVLLCPNMPYVAPLADRILELSADPQRAGGLTFTAPFDFSGHPTLSVPIGLSAERLPLSVQLVGARLAEGLLIRVGSALEAELEFEERPIP